MRSQYVLVEDFGETHCLAVDVPVSPWPLPRGSPPRQGAKRKRPLGQNALAELEAGLGELVQRQLFLSMGRTATQLHRDPFDNLYVCTAGARRWTLAHRDHAPWLVSPDEPDAISAACQPMLGDWGPDPEAARQVRFLSVILEPGDGLFLPAMWWHSVEGGYGAPRRQADDEAVDKECSADVPRFSGAVNWYYAPRGDQSEEGAGADADGSSTQLAAGRTLVRANNEGTSASASPKLRRSVRLVQKRTLRDSVPNRQIGKTIPPRKRSNLGRGESKTRSD